MSKAVVSSNSNSGIELSGAVFIVFLVLKLCNVIDWSWWWVTAPLWIPLVLILVVLVIVMGVVGVAGLISLFCMPRKREYVS